MGSVPRPCDAAAVRIAAQAGSRTDVPLHADPAWSATRGPARPGRGRCAIPLLACIGACAAGPVERPRDGQVLQHVLELLPGRKAVARRAAAGTASWDTQV